MSLSERRKDEEFLKPPELSEKEKEKYRLIFERSIKEYKKRNKIVAKSNKV